MTAHACHCVRKAVKAEHARILREGQDRAGTGQLTIEALRRIVLGETQ